MSYLKSFSIVSTGLYLFIVRFFPLHPQHKEQSNNKRRSEMNEKIYLIYI